MTGGAPLPSCHLTWLTLVRKSAGAGGRVEGSASAEVGDETDLLQGLYGVQAVVLLDVGDRISNLGA